MDTRDHYNAPKMWTISNFKISRLSEEEADNYSLLSETSTIYGFKANDLKSAQADKLVQCSRFSADVSRQLVFTSRPQFSVSFI